MAAADPQAFFLTPPPRHLAELRIDTAPSVVAFSAPCGVAKGAGLGRKRRCLVPVSSVRKRMLLELDPFDVAPAPSSTPPSRTLTPSPPPSPMESRAGAAPSPAGEFSFGTVLRAVPPASPGNNFKFVENTARTPAGSEAPPGQAAKPADATASGVPSFLAAPERPKTPTATGPTANGGFVFAAPPDGTLMPTSTNISGGPSFLASPKQPLTPMGSTATSGFPASSKPSLTPAGKGDVVSLISLKPARNDTGHFAFPSPGPACPQIGCAPPAATTESMPLAGLCTPPLVSKTPRSPPPLCNSGDGSYKRPSLYLRRAATSERRKSLRQLEEQQEFTPPPQKIAKTNALDAPLRQKIAKTNACEASRYSIMSGSSTSPCCTFFTSPSKEAAKQEAKKDFSEASRSPTGSHCSSPAKPATPEENKQEREVEASSSPREHPSTSPAVFCSSAEVVVRVTCKCGIHKEFCFDHRL